MDKVSSESLRKLTQTEMRLSESQIEDAISGHEARNAELRRIFVEKRVDFGEARLVDCHFWTWTKEDAAGLSKALLARGFLILSQGLAASSKDPSLWNVTAGIKQSIELTLRREFTDELVRVAAEHSGLYDGWGTAV
jgi:Regulator of ribonuclease activity B